MKIERERERERRGRDLPPHVLMRVNGAFQCGNNRLTEPTTTYTMPFFNRGGGEGAGRRATKRG